MERTFVMVKPEGVQRGLIGEVLRRMEQKGLKITRLHMTRLEPAVAAEHYAHLKDKPFFGELVEYITSGPVAMAVVEGPNAVRHVRNLIGATNPLEAAPGTIRGDFAVELPYNIVHASDSPETAEIEIKRFFGVE
ncbi:MAG: nucleoside-diphosphate kinase [Firmicutes bacterium ZCTH02-B6]|nr:MAG: nucleoside-diphosphate kinase [Firmicutes bacterium ZCTH02-B6]